MGVTGGREGGCDAEGQGTSRCDGKCDGIDACEGRVTGSGWGLRLF